MVLLNPTSRPNWSFVFVNTRSLFVPESTVVRFGVCTWCEYDSRKSVFSVIGNDTRTVGARVWCPTDGENTRASEESYAASLVPAASLHALNGPVVPPGQTLLMAGVYPPLLVTHSSCELLKIRPGVFENSALGSK